MNAATLNKAIVAAGCPTLSSTVGELDDRTTWSFIPAPGATQAQIDAGNNVIATFDFAAAEAADTARKAGLNADTDYLDFVSRLQGKTAAQVKTYVQTNVTDLASARLLLAKVLLYIARTI
jgi:hypothetical protein